MATLRTIAFLAVAVAICVLGLSLAAGGDLPAFAAGLLIAAAGAGSTVGFAVKLAPKPAPTPDPRGAILIRPNRSALTGYCAATVFAAAACLQTAVKAGSEGNGAAALAISGAAIFSIGAAYGLFKRLQPRALYRLDQIGIADLHEKNGWFVPWRAIRGIDPVSMSGVFWLALDVDETVGHFNKAHDKHMRKSACLLGAHDANVQFEQLTQMVQSYWQRGKLLTTHN